MIKINGKYIRNIPEQVGKNKRDIFQLDTDLSALEVKVNTALAGVFHYKGSVATYGDLPSSDNEVGDVYNVIDTGKNYAWDGSVWDDLGGLVDLSNYVDLTSEQTVSGHKIFSSLEGISAEKYSGMEYSSLTLNGDEGVYVTTGNSYRFVNIQGNLEPSADNTYSLGSSHSWKNLSLAGDITFDTTQTYYGKITKTAAGITIGTNVQDMLKFSGYGMYAISTFAPDVNNSIDLGSSTNAWKDLHLSGNIDFGNDTKINKDAYNGINLKVEDNTKLLIRAGVTYINNDFYPLTNGARSLGTNGATFKDLFLSGDITNGTDSVTVADLAALITYAKAQGWIS